MQGNRLLSNKLKNCFSVYVDFLTASSFARPLPRRKREASGKDFDLELLGVDHD